MTERDRVRESWAAQARRYAGACKVYEVNLNAARAECQALRAALAAAGADRDRYHRQRDAAAAALVGENSGWEDARTEGHAVAISRSMVAGVDPAEAVRLAALVFGEGEEAAT